MKLLTTKSRRVYLTKPFGNTPISTLMKEFGQDKGGCSSYVRGLEKGYDQRSTYRIVVRFNNGERWVLEINGKVGFWEPYADWFKGHVRYIKSTDNPMRQTISEALNVYFYWELRIK